MKEDSIECIFIPHGSRKL